MTNPRETPDLRDECDVRTGVHRGTCALCVGEASPFAEGLLLTHFQHTEDCHANPCSCHFYEDLAVIRVALAATPEPAPCRCEHPFSDHRTPGTECVVIGCHCEPYEPAPAVLDVERLTDQKAALLELIALMAKAIGDATFLVGTDGATTTLLVFGKGSPLGTDGLPLPPGQIVAGTGEPDGLVSALAKAMELVGTDNVELVRMPAALTATPSEAKP